MGMEAPAKLIEYGEYPEICADGVGDLRLIGTKLHIVLFRWRRMDGIYRPCICGEVIRSRAAILEEQLMWHRALKGTPFISHIALH